MQDLARGGIDHLNILVNDPIHSMIGSFGARITRCLMTGRVLSSEKSLEGEWVGGECVPVRT